MMHRTLALILLGGALLVTPAQARAEELKPHMWGWERILSLEYGPSEYHGKPVVEGVVTNTSPYDLAGVRLLVDTLDATGNVTSQRVSWVPGELRGGGRLHFSVPTPAAPAYRVRVFTYDRIESIGNQR